jgi:hypothetical protein
MGKKGDACNPCIIVDRSELRGGTSVRLRQEDHQQGHSEPGHNGFRLNAPRLPPHLRQLILILDLLDLRSQLARTSRRQTYSSLSRRGKNPDAARQRGGTGPAATRD